MYESEADSLLSNLYKEYMYKERIQERRKTYFSGLLHASNLTTKNNIREMDCTSLEKREDVSNNSIEKREQIRDTTVKAMSNMFKKMEQTVNMVHESSMTEDRVRVYKELVRRRAEDEEICDKNHRETAECHREIIELQAELQKVEHETIVKLNAKRCERDYFLECFQTLRNRYDADMRLDNERIRQLVDESYKTNKVSIFKI